jgi:hypothetical protein
MRCIALTPYSESQTTEKLVPSDESDDGTASFAPEVLTMMDS